MTPPAPPLDVAPDKALDLLATMIRIRRFEEACAERYSKGDIRGFLHLYIGEEAVATGILDVLGPDDAVLATYREHGHAIARGVPMDILMAEMFGKVEGCSRGRGGSMHLFDASRRFYGGSAIVAGGIPPAVGMALGDSMMGRNRVTACFFGEGAVAEGEFHESMNLAALWHLPVLFCVENNGYAMGTALARSESMVQLCAKAVSYGVPARTVDGMDVLAVRSAAAQAVAAIRSGAGPMFLELRTYRFRAHSMFDAELYRDPAEVERWKERGPIVTFVRRLEEQGLADPDVVERLRADADAEVAAAIAFAEAGTLESVDDLALHVLAPPDRREDPAPELVEPTGAMRTISYRDAMGEAIAEAMRTDPRVFLMGEDVGAYGGSYAVSKGFLEEFGPERIRDTPLCESGFVGAAIGASMVGMRPIVEVMTVNFSLLALDQILNTAATVRHMSGGQVGVPLVIRMATGAGRQLAAQHSNSLEGWYAHMPGLKVLAPATLVDARGMLGPALADPDPVVIFEHATLYNVCGEIPEDAGAVDITRAAVRRSGDDVTLIGWGGTVARCLEAAEALAAEGVSAEVIDLRVLRPLDRPTLIASAASTGRVVVVDEAWKTVGLSAEIAALITEGAFYSLDAPVCRVCSEEVPIPYARHLEQAAIPQVADIVAAVREVLHGDV